MKFTQTAFVLVLLFGTGVIIILQSRTLEFTTSKKTKPRANILNKSAQKVFQIDGPKQRLALLQRQCRSTLLKLITDLSTNRGLVNSRILVDPRHKLSYCNVPKIGSSFWYGAFAVLQDKQNATRSPYHMWDKYGEKLQRKVRLTNFKQLPLKSRDEWLQDSHLFLFVRDPYARLFSAYVDKFVMPNSFYWLRMGSVSIRYNRPNPSQFAMKCGHDFTFQEFLELFLAMESPGTKLESDHHWTPIYKLCSPCSYGYKFIGKTETFLNDTVEIIKRARLEDKIYFQRTSESAVKADIVKTVDIFLNHSVRLRGCVDGDKDLWRLWYAFKAKGYIKPDSEIPPFFKTLTSKNAKTIKDELCQKALKLYAEHSFPGSRAQYRHEILTKAFRDIPQHILMEVRRALLPDFLLFDYNPQPDYIFPNRSIFNDDDILNL